MIFENKTDILNQEIVYIIKEHRTVAKKDLPELHKLDLLDDYNEIKELLRRNPFAHVRNNEQLQNYKGMKKARSMRINGKQRVVFTVDKTIKTVWIWSAFGHYNDN
ncbi:MAG: Txe/YoeB family addiction module toxin [Lactobacillaceae bacterium]|jgi:Txe/YoeB family toxin of Txe-Axe toxin-antitoxin module|nr:Txe/YoeB family addiction module toxin [Lactobacillaceae bacterium]